MQKKYLCDAAQNWEREQGGFFEEVGQRGGACAAVPRDDVIVKARVRTAEWLKQELEGRDERKTHVIGGAAGLGKELQILKRTVRWGPQLALERSRSTPPASRLGWSQGRDHIE